MITLIITLNKITPIICLTKTDLLNEKETKEIKEIFNYYQSIGYTVVTNNNIKEIKKLIAGKIVVFAGQSGAGKSSLLNKLDKTLNLETNEISKALGRGKHTTRCTTLYDIDNSLIADTPGFSNFDIFEIPYKELYKYFKEFNYFNNKCEYLDCTHIKEEKCGIKEALQNSEISQIRYNNFKKVYEELKDKEEHKW